MSQPNQISEIMANAKKAIEEKKAMLGLTVEEQRNSNIEALKARIAAKTASLNVKLAPSIDSNAQLIHEQVMLQQQTILDRERSLNLIIDSEGRTIDKRTGEVVKIESRMPTLKANMKAAQKRDYSTALGGAGAAAAVPEKRPAVPGTATDLFASGISSTLSTVSSVHSTFLASKAASIAPAAPASVAAASTSAAVEGQSEFFDPRLKIKTAERNKRKLVFNEKGKFEEIANKLRTKAKLQQLQQEIQTISKRTGISSDSRLALIQPKRSATKETIPMIEWWDFTLLNETSYDCIETLSQNAMIEKMKITNLVEHPVQMKPPTQSDKKVVPTVMLTKKERKKLRRQNRIEALKEEQEKIRLGLLPPPEPKVKISNLMRVLGTEAVQDPTKVEEYVRNQMAKRQKTHEEANASRKLTDAERAAKKKRKIMENTALCVNVSVYRVKDLSDPAVKFKLEANCNQLHMTGIVLLCKNLNVVVVEGGPKQQKKFRRLMLNRIKWAELEKRKQDPNDERANEKNSCALVWEGQVKTRTFGNIIFKMCPTPAFARDFFKKQAVEHYWDIAQSDEILQMADN